MFNIARRSDRSTMPNQEKTQIALVQMRCGQEPDANLAHALDLIGDAAKNGAQIVCLPELFRSQYFCQSENHDNFSLAENIPGPSTDALTKLKRHRGLAFRKTRRWGLSQYRSGD